MLECINSVEYQPKGNIGDFQYHELSNRPLY